MKTCTFRFYVKCNFSDVGVGQILKMETQDFRAAAKHCKKLMSTQEIYEELSGVWGKDCSKHTTIKTWARKFRRTRTNTCREPGSGRYYYYYYYYYYY